MNSGKMFLQEINYLNFDNNNKINIKNPINIKKILVILLMIILIIVSLYFLYVSYNNYLKASSIENENEYANVAILTEEELKEKFENEKDNIIVEKDFFGANNELIVLLKNENQENIADLIVQAIFYDNENKPISVCEKDISYLSADSEYYLKFTEIPEDYANYDFLITKENFWNDDMLVSIKDDISYEASVDDKDILSLKFKNNSKNSADYIKFVSVYYDENDNIIDVEDWCYFDITKNKTVKEDIYIGLYDTNTCEDISYDRVETKLVNAYRY
jgi:hypothetical protein